MIISEDVSDQIFQIRNTNAPSAAYTLVGQIDLLLLNVAHTTRTRHHPCRIGPYPHPGKASSQLGDRPQLLDDVALLHRPGQRDWPLPSLEILGDLGPVRHPLHKGLEARVGIKHVFPQDQLGRVESVEDEEVAHDRRVLQEVVLRPQHLLNLWQDRVQAYLAAVQSLLDLLVLEIRRGADDVEHLQAHDDDVLVRERNERRAGGRVFRLQPLPVAQLLVQVHRDSLRLRQPEPLVLKNGQRPEGPRDFLVGFHVEPVTRDDVVDRHLVVLVRLPGVHQRIPQGLSPATRVEVPERHPRGGRGHASGAHVGMGEAGRGARGEAPQGREESAKHQKNWAGRV
mmetsp:Transcript_66668/g.164311  ORF Transcript_66668/g.164311 Transcript_66668/m.164311 type:complete len:341 (-) Transcript_66668:7-1029(-)